MLSLNHSKKLQISSNNSIGNLRPVIKKCFKNKQTMKYCDFNSHYDSTFKQKNCKIVL